MTDPAEIAAKLTPAQMKALPDLVALAMIGFSLIKSSPYVAETDHPAIKAFYPSVSAVLKTRSDRRKAEFALRFGGDVEISDALAVLAALDAKEST